MKSRRVSFTEDTLRLGRIQARPLRSFWVRTDAVGNLATFAPLIKGLQDDLLRPSYGLHPNT